MTQLGGERERLAGCGQAAGLLAPLLLAVEELPLDLHLATQRRRPRRALEQLALDRAAAPAALDLDRLEIERRRQRRADRAGRDLGDLDRLGGGVAVLVQGHDLDRVRP